MDGYRADIRIDEDKYAPDVARKSTEYIVRGQPDSPEKMFSLNSVILYFHLKAIQRELLVINYIVRSIKKFIECNDSALYLGVVPSTLSLKLL